MNEQTTPAAPEQGATREALAAKHQAASDAVRDDWSSGYAAGLWDALVLLEEQGSALAAPPSPQPVAVVQEDGRERLFDQLPDGWRTWRSAREDLAAAPVQAAVAPVRVEDAVDAERERCVKVLREMWYEREASHGNRAGPYHNGWTAALDIAERRIVLRSAALATPLEAPAVAVQPPADDGLLHDRVHVESGKVRRLVPEDPGLRKLAAFGAWAAREFRASLSDIDGGSAQDAMERSGVIERRTVTEPCGEGCVCVEYGEFPHDCHPFAEDVLTAFGALDSSQAVAVQPEPENDQDMPRAEG